MCTKNSLMRSTSLIDFWCMQGLHPFSIDLIDQNIAVLWRTSSPPYLSVLDKNSRDLLDKCYPKKDLQDLKSFSLELLVFSYLQLILYMFIVILYEGSDFWSSICDYLSS